MSARKLPGSLDTNRRLNQWLSINRDGTVTVRPGKVEIGQGILTALIQIVAEELDVAVERIRIVPAATSTLLGVNSNFFAVRAISLMTGWSCAGAAMAGAIAALNDDSMATRPKRPAARNARGYFIGGLP